MSEIGRIIEMIFPGVKVVPMPNIDLINQLLKISETDKDKALKHLISLFKTVSGTVDRSSPQHCYHSFCYHP